MYKQLEVKVTGTTPLLMHNGLFSSPMNPWSKRLKVVSSKRNKTEADYLELAKIEFMGGLYPQGGQPRIIMPALVVRANLVRGGARLKLGMDIKRGVLVLDDSPLIYPDPQGPEERWDAGLYDIRPVKIGQSKLDRTRPIFYEWSFTTTIHYDPSIIDKDPLLGAMEIAGQQVGLLDYRPEKGGIYGRFEIA